MIFSRSVTALLVAATLPLAAFAAAKRSAPTRPTEDDPSAYKGAIVMDAATGNVLFERNADEISPPASMTKLMTFAVLHDKLQAGSVTLATPGSDYRRRFENGRHPSLSRSPRDVLRRRTHLCDDDPIGE